MPRAENDNPKRAHPRRIRISIQLHGDAIPTAVRSPRNHRLTFEDAQGPPIPAGPPSRIVSGRCNRPARSPAAAWPGPRLASRSRCWRRERSRRPHNRRPAPGDDDGPLTLSSLSAQSNASHFLLQGAIEGVDLGGSGVSGVMVRIWSSILVFDRLNRPFFPLGCSWFRNLGMLSDRAAPLSIHTLEVR